MRGDFASRSKAKAKSQRRDSASSSTRTIPTGERTWTDIQPGKFSLSHDPVSKKLMYLLRHGSLLRDNDGAIEFWRIKRLSSGSFRVSVITGLTKSGRSVWQEEEDTRKDFSIVLIRQEQSLYLRALQGHSGRNLIDPTLQDTGRDSGRFLQVHFITSDVQSIYIRSSIQD